MTTQFKICASDGRAVAALQNAFGLPRFLAATLVARGIDTPEAAEDFLNPAFERNWCNPYELDCMPEVIDALADALSKKQHILVFGDFDVDGITATTVMTRGLRALGGHVTPFIPKRFEEGYGITPAALERVLSLKPDVMITVDCGISCVAEIAAAREAGLKVLVSDHHEAGAELPHDVAIVDPKAYEHGPAHELAGVGVALKIIQALGAHMGYPHLWKSYTDFAALGTVADLMPMLGENRPLVRAGIERMNVNPRPCIAALMQVVGAEPGSVRASNLSFSLVPRLNAAGRMGDASIALDLMLCDNYADAYVLAQKLEDLNNLRRQIESELSVEALAKAERLYAGERVVVVAGEGWHEGVKGIVASRLVNRFGVPALLFTIDGDEARGSGRSVGSVNLHEAVSACSHLLTRFGGHEAAVGVTLPVANLAEFKRELNAYMSQLDPKQFSPMFTIDAMVALNELTLDDVAQVVRLEPFGQENPEPRLMAKNVVLDNMRAVGAAKNHFSCRLTDGRSAVDAILFNAPQIEHLMANDTVVDAAFTPQIDEWRGRKSVKCMLSVLEPARVCSALDGCADPVANALLSRIFDPNSKCPAYIDPSKFDEIMQATQGGEGVVDQVKIAASPSPSPSPLVSAGEAPVDEFAGGAAIARAHWEALAAADPEALEAALISAIIGDHTPHAAQVDILSRLKAGTSTLGVMATGRGKSLIFQVFAAELALSQNKASLFVYPLRALMADQAFHLSRQFEKFGLVCAVLNGETTQPERLRIYDGLAAGKIDIVLTTPEYLSFHADEIAKSGRIGFVVVDEAHHIGQAKAGTRPAYKTLGEVVDALGAPVVLAVTATSPTQVARDIIGTLPIVDHVIDDHSRDNLHLDDQRNIPNRDDYLAHIVAGGGKCVIYVNSRDQSVSVARRLRARVPQLAPYIGFYNAGLGKCERARIEDLFRSGKLQVLVATSAFGEGIDIPDIRHVVLYHMPFSDVEFNQMSGRAGRDGRASWVHLLYSESDASINEGLLADMTPARDTMAQIYRVIRDCAQSGKPCMTGGSAKPIDAASKGFDGRNTCDASGAQEASRPNVADNQTSNQAGSQPPAGFVPVDLESLARAATTPKFQITPTSAACAVSVFNELGLIDARETFTDGRQMHSVRMRSRDGKVELTDSIRYREGLDEILKFHEFREWALRSDARTLTIRITHPITPDLPPQ